MECLLESMHALLISMSLKALSEKPICGLLEFRKIIEKQNFLSVHTLLLGFLATLVGFFDTQLVWEAVNKWKSV